MSRDDAVRAAHEGTADSLPEQQQAVVITDSESMLLHRARRSTGNDRVYIAMVATILGIAVSPFLLYGGWVGAVTSVISISLLLRAKQQRATLSSHMAVIRIVTFGFNILHLALLLLSLIAMALGAS